MKPEARVDVVGKLLRDPEVKKVGEQTVKEFTVLVQHQNNVSFFDCEIWGKEAEAMTAKQDSLVQLEGVLRQDRWADKDTGDLRNKVRIRAGFVEEIDLTPTKERVRAVREHAESLKPGARVEASSELPESAVDRGEKGEVLRVSDSTVTVRWDSGSRTTLSKDDALSLAPTRDLAHDLQLENTHER